MFRQVILSTWADGIGEAERQAYRDGLESLRPIPELVALRHGDDAGHFEGNFDYAVVQDFVSFDAARRYVAHPLHQAYVEQVARPSMGQRVVVQHEWGSTPGEVVGLHHLKLPVSDVGVSEAWWCGVFGFTVSMTFEEDGVVRGVALDHPVAHVSVALREDPARAAALAGFDAVCFAVGTRADLETVAARLDAVGVAHTAIAEGRLGWTLDVPDPDGIVVRLYTYESRFASSGENAGTQTAT